MSSATALAKPFAPDFSPDQRAKGKSHFQTAFWFVSREKRQALDDLYAYCRLADDISDAPELTLSDRKAGLAAIRNWVEHSQESEHQFWRRWQQTIERFQIPKFALLAILDGVAHDITDQAITFETWEELDRYVYGVAGCAGVCVLAILGWRGSEAESHAEAMGRTLQYLNIMRDIEEDATLGRTYVPRSLSHVNVRPTIYARALEMFAQTKTNRWAALPGFIMAEIYFYGARKYWLAGKAQRLSKMQKFRCASFAVVKFILGRFE